MFFLLLVSQLHQTLLRYVNTFEEMYTKDLCTPNMHCVLHLRECILMFGPVHAHWTFPWERMNGCMGSIPMNRHHDEQQFMRSFVRRMVLRELPSLTCQTLSADETKLFESLWGEVRSNQRGFTATELIDAAARRNTRGRIIGEEDIDASLVKPVEATFGPLDQVEWDYLKLSVVAHFKFRSAPTIEQGYERSSQLRFYGEMVSVATGRLKTSSFVLVTVNDRVLPTQCLRFLRCRIHVKWGGGPDTTMIVLLVRLQFFPRYSEEDNNSEFDDTLHTWSSDVDPWPGSAWAAPHPVRYWPVQRIKSRFVLAPCTIQVANPKTNKSKAKGIAPLRRPVKLFKTCPLPLQLPF